jgi:hypothetical protein
MLKQLIAIKAHIQTNNFQNMLEAHWAFILVAVVVGERKKSRFNRSVNRQFSQHGSNSKLLHPYDVL